MRRTPPLAVPVVLRSPGDLGSPADGDHPIREIAWVLSPSTVVAFSRNPHDIVAPLATNFIVRLEKTATLQ
jgi:hypothetical protein